MLALEEPEERLLIEYPNTCKECPDRGLIRVFGAYLQPDFVTMYSHETREWEWHNIGWPTRCKKCNTRAQALKRAKKSVNRLEEIRIMTDEAFEAWDRPAEWAFLKFVTLTWKNENTSSPEPDMKKARKWLQRKRDKIIMKLHAIAGTDVLECVTTPLDDGKFHHHIHSHGVWVMPYHDIEYIGEIMTRYVGRDQTRAITDKWIEKEDHPDGGYMMPAMARARNYLMKYLTKTPGARRSLWGLARTNCTAEDFYSRWDEVRRLTNDG